MSKVLYIKANPKGDEVSSTFRISEAFLRAYKQAHPSDEVKTLDLYRLGVGPLNAEELAGIFGDHGTPFFDLANEFASANKIIIAAPMWNLGIPSILKSYIDRVVVSGITFKYTATGPIGLLAGKGIKALHITSRGGVYQEGPAKDYELGDRYLRTIFGFLGIVDFTTIANEGTGMLPPEKAKLKLEENIALATKAAAGF